jgi:hypothetical protein
MTKQGQVDTGRFVVLVAVQKNYEVWGEARARSGQIWLLLACLHILLRHTHIIGVGTMNWVIGSPGQ